MRLLKPFTAVALVLLLLAGMPQTSAMAAGYATLKAGDSGAEVIRMQTALISLNYLSDAADGQFGTKTQEAVKGFQGGNSLEVDGLAGNQTLTALYRLAGTGSPATAGANDANGTLVYGDSGSAVKTLQAALTGLGYATGGTDGEFGNMTLSAVKAFQRANRLTADGKAGASTLAKLYALAGSGSNAGGGTAPADSPVTLSGTLVYGNSGSAVKSMQAALTKLGYATGGTDGKFGNMTLNAVKAFQRANKLTADGKAGPQTLAKLYALADSGNTPPAGYTTLRSGASGEAVRALQKQLASLDYKAGVTGKYDSQTVQAVRSFQSLNNLAVDGMAGIKTQTLAYSGKARKYSAQSAGYGAPSKSQVKLMHWFNEVKPALRGKSSIYVHDPASGYGFTLHLYSLGSHADVEPLTAKDTENMMAAFGGKATWTPKFVYVCLPGGTWTAATMHNVAHGGQSIRDNDFNGQNCVHFLRDMDEVTRNDPDYGVTNQLALRKGWKNLTGEIVE